MEETQKSVPTENAGIPTAKSRDPTLITVPIPRIRVYMLVQLTSFISTVPQWEKFRAAKSGNSRYGV